MMVREVGPQALVYSGSSTWTAGPNGTATVALIVTENKPGYEGRYFWNYTVTNQNYLPTNPLSAMLLNVSEVGGLDNLASSLGWVGSVTVNTSGPHYVRWQASGGQSSLGTGQSAIFSFTTPVTGIGESSGRMGFYHPPPPPGFPGGVADPVPPSGAVKAPELMIRSVTLWGQPGAPSLQGALGGQMATLSGTVLGNNPNAGGGKRIFPEKPTWGDTVRSFEEVDVRVELSQPVAVAKNVRMCQFDVDDPSSFDGDLDYELMEYDNRHGPLNNISPERDFTVTVGVNQSVGSRLCYVGRQPGDNYRFVVTIDPTVVFHSPGFGLKNVDIGQFQDYPPGGDPVTVYFDGEDAGVYFNGGQGDPVATEKSTTVTSTLLTVWRRLHVERDIMDAPPPNEPFAGAGNLMPGSAKEGDMEGDDDVAPNGMDGTIPRPGIGYMQAGFRPAYIEVVDDLQPRNTNMLVTFLHNMGSPLPKWLVDYDAIRAQMDAENSEGFWAFQLVGAYEDEVTNDQDGAGDSTTCGITLHRRITSIVYTETIVITGRAISLRSGRTNRIHSRWRSTPSESRSTKRCIYSVSATLV